MSTDLFDESELDTDDSDFDWENFLPDPEDGAVEGDGGASAGADDGELDVDDSEFEWEANLHSEDPLPEEDDGVRAARIEAAFARMEQAVTGAPSSVADGTPHSGDGPGCDGAAEEDAEPELLLVPDTELPAREESWPELDLDADIEPEPELVLLDEEAETEWALLGAAGLAAESRFAHELLEPGPAANTPSVFEPDADVGQTPIYEPAAAYEPAAPYEPAAAYEPAAEYESEVAYQSEPVHESEAVCEPAAYEPVAYESHSVYESQVVDEPVAYEPAVYESEAVYEPEAVNEPPEAPPQTAADEPVEVGDDPSVDSGSTSSRREPHSRVYTATVVLACSLLVLVAAVLIIRSVERSSTTPAPHHSTRTPAPTPAKSDLLQTARIRAATDEANLATTTALAGMSPLSYLASPNVVAQVANPYAESLQLYASFLSGAQVPAQARSVTAQVLAEAQSDASFLGTIRGIAPGQLGSYLHSFYANAAQLQTSLIALENQLPSTSSS